MAIDEKKLAELKAKYGEVWTYEKGPYTFVLCCPGEMVFRKYSIDVAEDRSRVWDAQAALARAAIVYPEKDESEAILEKRPMLIPAIAGQVASIAAEETKLEAKKA